MVLFRVEYRRISFNIFKKFESILKIKLFLEFLGFGPRKSDLRSNEVIWG